LARILALLFGVGAAFLAVLPGFEAQAVELVFGGGEEALDVLVLAMMGWGPVGHFDFEEVV
jgi:hypothetical protein